MSQHIGTPAYPALIALAGEPPTARQIGKEPFLGLGITFAFFNGARNSPFQLITSSSLIFNNNSNFSSNNSS